MATTPDLQEPLITAARAQAWHQTGTSLATLEAARTWLNEAGLLLFAPRGAGLGAPAPSLVEATLGKATTAATLEETAVARTLTARLVGEGSAIPLNLLGGPGDLPDFLVSAQAFPFVFTLRGDKGWKRAPETSGAVKVTPLGLRVYELLDEKGSLTVADIVSEAGREVTESAVARALGELWQLLRVIPVLQQGEGETRWELTTSRYLKAIKAGANAGQPTALSALVSLYLGQVYVATEEEIAAFLSPLTARSRVRDTIHGLGAGRQLAEGVIQGKTVLYIPDGLPDLAAFAPKAAEEDPEVSGSDAEGEGDTASGAHTESDEAPAPPQERIRRFGGEGDRPQDRNLRGKPLARRDPGSGSRDGSRPPRPGTSRGSRDGIAGRSGADRPPFRGRSGERPGRPEGAGGGFRRPRPAAEGSSFSRPWEEERSSRPPRPRGEAGAAGEADGREPRPGRSTGTPRGDRPFRSAGGEGGRPPRRFDARPSRFDARPSRPFARADGDSSNASTNDRGKVAPRGERPARPFREKGAGDRPFRPRPDGERPSRPRAGGGDRPFRARPEGGEGRPFRPRPEGGGDRPYRPRPEGGGERPFRPRAEGGDRPFRPRAASGDRPFRARPEGRDDRAPRAPREGGERPYRPRPEGGARPFRPGVAGAPERRGPGRPPSRFSGGEGRPERPRTGAAGSRGAEGGSAGAGRSRPSFGGGGGFGGGRPSRGGDRPAGRPAGRGTGGRPPAKRAGGKPPSRPDRPARRPRPEDEA